MLKRLIWEKPSIGWKKEEWKYFSGRDPFPTLRRDITPLALTSTSGSGKIRRRPFPFFCFSYSAGTRLILKLNELRFRRNLKTGKRIEKSIWPWAKLLSIDRVTYPLFRLKTNDVMISLAWNAWMVWCILVQGPTVSTWQWKCTGCTLSDGLFSAWPKFGPNLFFF